MTDEKTTEIEVQRRVAQSFDTDERKLTGLHVSWGNCASTMTPKAKAEILMRVIDSKAASHEPNVRIQQRDIRDILADLAKRSIA